MRNNGIREVSIYLTRAEHGLEPELLNRPCTPGSAHLLYLLGHTSGQGCPEPLVTRGGFPLSRLKCLVSCVLILCSLDPSGTARRTAFQLQVRSLFNLHRPPNRTFSSTPALQTKCHHQQIPGDKQWGKNFRVSCRGVWRVGQGG